MLNLSLPFAGDALGHQDRPTYGTLHACPHNAPYNPLGEAQPKSSNSSPCKSLQLPVLCSNTGPSNIKLMQKAQTWQPRSPPGSAGLSPVTPVRALLRQSFPCPTGRAFPPLAGVFLPSFPGYGMIWAAPSHREPPTPLSRSPPVTHLGRKAQEPLIKYGSLPHQFRYN